MKTIEIDNKTTGWTKIPGDTQNVVAYFEDGHSEVMSIFQFLASKRRKNVLRIDCYTSTEQVPKLCL